MTSAMDAAEYVRQLETLQRIREIAGGQTLHLPQICVVGDQSSGKSSLLKLLTGVDFPVHAGTCTKAAIVVECKKQMEEKYEIMDYSTNEYKECEFSELAKKILECQGKMLNEGRGCKISDDEIKIKVGGEDKIDIIVVDLPGIINTGPGKEETRRLIENYIEPEQTLIFLVSEAKTDVELISAEELVMKYDPEGSRTMKVLTKFDTFDSDDARKRAVDWIVENEKKELGAHAVIAAPDGREYDENKEREKLEEMKLPVIRSGIGALKARLPTIYAKLIQTNLIGLRERIQKKRTDAKMVLQAVGEIPIDSTTLIKRCQTFLLDNMIDIKETLSPSMTELQDEIHKKKGEITKAWTSAKFCPNVFDVPFFSGEPAFKKCFSKIIEWWQPILDTYIVNVETTLVETIEKLGEVSIPQTLSLAVKLIWKAKCEDIVNTLKKECKNEQNKFRNFGTVNHYLTSEYQKELAIPKEVISKFITSLKEVPPPLQFPQARQIVVAASGNGITQTLIPCTLNETKETVQRKLESAYEDHLAEFGRKSLHDQQKDHLFAAVKAAYKVEKKTFTDLIMKATNIHVLEAVANWINTDLLQNERIKHAAKEDAATINARNKALDTIKKMDECHTEINNIM